MMPTAMWMEFLVEKFRQLAPRPVRGSMEGLTTSKNSASRFDDTTKPGLDEGALMVSRKTSYECVSWETLEGRSDGERRGQPEVARGQQRSTR